MSTPTTTTAITAVTPAPSERRLGGGYNEEPDPFERHPQGPSQLAHADRGVDVRRAFELREEARTLLQQVLEESLAPLHFGLRDLERRLQALETQAAEPPSAPPAPVPVPIPAVAHAPVPVPQVFAAAPYAAAPPAPAAFADPYPAQIRVAASPADAYGGFLTNPQPAIPAPPRMPSFDYGVVPFDGARRKRRVVAFFALLLVIIFGGLFTALIWSRVS
jgi:hypothetical protein